MGHLAGRLRPGRRGRLSQAHLGQADRRDRPARWRPTGRSTTTWAHILQRDWKTLGPKLQGKIHIYVGDMDNYYLNNAVYLVESFLESTKDPYYAGDVDYGDRAEHCWNGDHDPAQRPIAPALSPDVHPAGGRADAQDRAARGGPEAAGNIRFRTGTASCRAAARPCPCRCSSSASGPRPARRKEDAGRRDGGCCGGRPSRRPEPAPRSG